MQQGNVIIYDLDVFDPGRYLLPGYFTDIPCLSSLQHHIAQGSTATHQDQLIVSLAIAYPVIVVFCLFYLTGDQFCQALTAIAVAAAIAKGKARAEAGFKQRGISLGNKLATTGKYTYLFCHKLPGKSHAGYCPA